MNATSLRLPADLNTRLNALAQRTGRSKTFYILEAVRKHLEELEDIYEADVIMKRVRDGEEELYTSEEMEKMLALDN